MKIAVIAPHPDDETLGCGGTLYRHKKDGDNLYWNIITGIEEDSPVSKTNIKTRKNEIEKVARKYDFIETYNFNLPTTKLDALPLSELINKISHVQNIVKPEIIYMPYLLDVHTDHQIVSTALQATIKWFRYPYIKKVLMYETPSETEFNFANQKVFNPNVFINISDFLQKKIETMKIYLYGPQLPGQFQQIKL